MKVGFGAEDFTPRSIRPYSEIIPIGGAKDFTLMSIHLWIQNRSIRSNNHIWSRPIDTAAVTASPTKDDSIYKDL